MTPLRLLLLALLIIPVTASSQPRPVPQGPVLDRDQVSAAGRAEVIATVPAFGRFAIVATSDEGTAVSLVDRMTGPGPFHGSPGEVDGRIDAFLDRGEYKIVTRGHPRAAGEARLAVHPFREQSGQKPPRLVEHRLVEATLNDLEQRSYWIHLERDQVVILEAAGRSLSDLRLWRDGRWLVDVAPEVQEIHPRIGEPLGSCRLTAQLQAGLYLLSAYGGPAREWSEDPDPSVGHPFYLRYGIPELPSIGRSHREVSPFGVDRFRLPSGSNYVRIDLPEQREAELQLSPFEALRPFRAGSRAVIRKDSVMPTAELTGPNIQSGLMATVSAEAGQTYVLQHFPIFSAGGAFRAPEGEGPDRYWVSTVSSGSPLDYSDATAVISRHWSASASQPARIERIARSEVPVGPGTPWARRFDIQGTTTVHLEVSHAGTYRFDSEPGARFRIEPFMIGRPPRYVTPDLQPSGSEWTLGAGAHVLTIEPKTHGVVEASLIGTAPDATVGSLWRRLTGQGAGGAGASEAEPALAAAQWTDLGLASSQVYDLHPAARPGVRIGLVVRRLPIDPADPLPVVQRPGETIEIPLRISEVGVLRAVAEDGALLPITIGEERSGTELRLGPGRYTVRVRHEGEATVLYSLGLEPLRLSREVPLPALSQALLDQRPIFPVLSAGEIRYLDLGRQAQATFSVNAAEPALYRLESVGLLDTEGNLRTRIIPSFERSSTGGAGRNFMIARYLREGDYQLTVSTRGRSTGRLGLRLSPTQLIDGGMLREGVAARAEVPAGAGLLYRFEVTQTATHRIESLGLGRTFRIRLEDDDGWPIIRPGVDGNLSLELQPGIYRLIVLPEPVETRRVIRISLPESQLAFTGHGPHELPLDRPVTHQWREPAEGEERLPDVWTFELPATAPVRIELGSRMEGTLWQGERKIAEVPPVRGWSGSLSAGLHRLEVRALRIDDRVDYRLAVRPEALLAGLTRELQAPHAMPVMVGESGLVEISAFGRDDVRARLLDASGELLADNDDRPGDWSFLLSRYLRAGEYRLEIDPVGAPAARTTVTMKIPRERIGEAIATPLRHSLRPGDEVLLHPLQISGAGLLVLAADSSESIGIALEVSHQSDETWRTVDSRVGRRVRLEVPLPGSGSSGREGPGATGEPRRGRRGEGVAGWSYRVRLWSADRGGNPVVVRALVVEPRAISEADLSSGTRMDVVPGIEPSVAVSGLAPERPGALVVRAPSDFESVRWTDQIHVPARSTMNGTLLRSAGGTAWLIRDVAEEGEVEVRAERASVPSEGNLALTVPQGDVATVDVDPEPGRRGLFRRAEAARGPVVVRAVARAGQPAVEIVERDQTLGSGDLRVMGAGPSVATAVSLSGSGRVVKAWDADPSMRQSSLEVRLTLTENAAAEPVPAGHGMHDGLIRAGSSVAFDLPSGAKTLRLTLDDALVAVLSDGDEVKSVHGGVGEAVSEVLLTRARRLTLMPVEPREGRFAYELLPAAKDEQRSVASGRPFHRSERTHGLLRVGVMAPTTDDGSPHTVRVRGAVEQTILLGADGTIGQGDAPVPPGGGVLLVHHRAGSVFAWVEGEDGEGLVAAEDAERRPRRVSPPSNVRLRGEVEVLQVEGADEPIMLHLRGSVPVAASVAGPGMEPRVDIHPEGMREDVFLPAGAARIVLRALGEAPSRGTLTLTSTTMLRAAEGLGPEVLLGPGEARGFFFDVERSGPIGAGVQGESDRVEAFILDSTGRPVPGAEGFVVAMPTLEAGRYVLVLRAAPSAAPLRVRPALAGIEPPDSGPPDEVIRGYLSSAGSR